MRVRRCLAFVSVFVSILAACSDGSKTNTLPDIRSPGRTDGGSSSGGDAGDAGVLTPENDASVIDTTTCKNGVKDGDETDVDCGGATCSPCANGKGCLARRDCASLVCSGTTCNGNAGCSDGTREAFADPATFPNIAACSGGWSMPGVLATLVPACTRLAGNDSANPAGNGCNVADLCQVGWHVCTDATDVANKSDGNGCANAAFPADTFFVVRVSGSGAALCEAMGANDIFGCGTAGVAPDPGTCGVLDRFSNDLCQALPQTFQCGMDGGEEANAVTKNAADNGGVLCCRD